MPLSAAAQPAPPAPRRSVGRAHAVPHCRGSPRWMPRSRCRCVQYRQSASTALRTSAPCPVAPPSSRHTRNPPSLPAGRYTLYRPTVAPCLLFVRNFKIAGATVRPPAFPANRRRAVKKRVQAKKLEAKVFAFTLAAATVDRIKEKPLPLRQHRVGATCYADHLNTPRLIAAAKSPGYGWQHG